MKIRQCIMTAMIAALTMSAFATEHIWTQTAAGTSYVWTNVVNWLPSTSYPNGAGQTASITNDILGGQTIYLRRNITLGTLNIGDAVASGNNYGIKILNYNLGDTLIFDSGLDGVMARLNTGNSGTPTVTLQAPMALNSDLLVNIGGTNSTNRQNLTFNTVTALNGHNLVFTNGVSGQSQLNIALDADFSGSGTLVNNSQISVAVTGGKTFGGSLIANKSTFGLTAGGFTNAAQCIINGSVSNTTTQLGGTLDSGNNSAFTNNPGQRLTRHQITFNGGTLNANGQQAKIGTANNWQKGLEWVRDDVSRLDLRSGYNYLFINKSSNTTGTELYVNTLLRSSGATLFFVAKITNCYFHAANASDFLSGAGGQAGSTTMSIVPWMGVSSSTGALSPSGFSTYEVTRGFRELASNEYASTVTAGATCNVSLTAFNPLLPTTDATINALRLAGVGGNIGANKTLTITSGSIFFTSYGSTLGTSGDAAAGTVNFGAAEGVVTVFGTNADTIGAKITGTGGLTKSNTGTLTLTGVNNYGGTNHVSGGTLRVGDGTYASNLGSGDVDVHAGAKLRISCANAIANSATVKLYNLGPDMYFGKMEIDSGVNETVRFLFLGDEPMAAGTYGGTGSGATYILPAYFSGTGILTVSSNAAALGGTTLITVR